MRNFFRTCDRIEALVERRLDGELGERRAARVGRHLATCPRCGKIASDLRMIRGWLAESAVEAEGRASMVDWPRLIAHLRLDIRPAHPVCSPSARLPIELIARLRLDSVLTRLRVFLYPLSRVWAPAVVLAGLAIGLTLLFRSPGPIPAPLPHESVIQAVRSEDGNVMVYQTREGGMTIIWVFEPRPTTVEPQASNPVEPPPI